MSELLNVQNVTVVGLLLVACVYLVKSNDKNLNKLTEQHEKEEARIIADFKEMKEERVQERKEWLGALGKNTEQLKNVADKLEIIPNIQKDLDNLKVDVAEIKNKLK